MKHVEVLIAGAGAAGMAAALAAKKKGFRSILIADRRNRPGGVLNQCTHTGFGLGYFGTDLTGRMYAERFVQLLEGTGIDVFCGTTVAKLSRNRTALLCGSAGAFPVSFDQFVLATGCREKTLYSQGIAGTRPAGIFTCGTAQKLMNEDGLDPGDDIVILGTGDVGQIVARDLIRAGKRVIAMIEKNPFPGGLRRNQENCIRAYSIPVILETEIARISGEGRIDGVWLRDLRTGGERFLACRTLLTAIGLIPETELEKECFQEDPRPDWFRAAGNADYVHDIVDSVTMESLKIWD